ncbi:MAG: hypothetical protein OFPI_30670 [Osedax symbiont Rs2]|nr:MAG: hypothetical protein OFPI_30670 [Osedax symbiont Rs2]
MNSGKEAAHKISRDELGYINVSELNDSLVELLKLEEELIEISLLGEKLAQLADKKLVELVSMVESTIKNSKNHNRIASRLFTEVSELTTVPIHIYILFNDQTRTELEKTSFIANNLHLIFHMMQEKSSLIDLSNL